MSEPKPSPCLPGWARSFMDDWWSREVLFESSVEEDDDDMRHRRKAFCRLYTADDADIRAMWKYVETSIPQEDRKGFFASLILFTDEIYPDEPLPYYKYPDYRPPRLRTREQRKARKLAELLQLLRAVTPPRCIARNSESINTGIHVEALAVYFDIGDVPCDYNLRWKLTELGIEYTADSKRGWIQHRRASDKVRHKAIKAACELAAMSGAQRHAAWINRLANALEALPAMKAEHAGDLALLSREAGYPDWVRAVLVDMDTYRANAEKPFLRQRDLATLARVIAGAPQNVTEDAIAHITTAVAAFLSNLHT